MMYSSFQVLFCLCHIRAIPLEIKTLPRQGFCFIIGPDKSLATVKPFSQVFQGNGYNDFYTISVMHRHLDEHSITCQTGILTIELCCRQLLDLIVPDLNGLPEVSLETFYLDGNFPNAEDHLQHMFSKIKRQPLDSMRAQWDSEPRTIISDEQYKKLHLDL